MSRHPERIAGRARGGVARSAAGYNAGQDPRVFQPQLSAAGTYRRSRQRAAFRRLRAGPRARPAADDIEFHERRGACGSGTQPLVGLPGPSTYRWEPGRLPTASMVVSADDMARFVLWQLGEGPPILSDPSRALMHRGVGKSEYFSYAMGWREGTTGGVPSLWHGGAVPSYRVAVVMLPQSRSAVIVLINMSTMFVTRASRTHPVLLAVPATLEHPTAALCDSRPSLRSSHATLHILTPLSAISAASRKGLRMKIRSLFNDLRTL